MYVYVLICIDAIVVRLTDECVDGLRFEASSILANSGTAESMREFRNRYSPARPRIVPL